MRRGMWALSISAAVVLLGTLILSGVPPQASLLLVGVLALQSVSGAIVWRALVPEASASSLLGMGIAIGTAMATVAGALVSTVGWGMWGWVVPSAAIAALLPFRAVRRRLHSPTDASVRPLSAPEIWGLLVAAVGGLAALAINLRDYPLSWSGAWSGYHPDMAFFEALSTSIARYGIADSIFAPTAEIRYHWFAYGWAGQVAATAGTEPFVVLTRLLPTVALIASSLLVVSWSRRLSDVPWVPALAAALLVAGGHIGAVYGGVLTHDSPSQSMAVVWALGWATSGLLLLDAGTRRAGGFFVPLIGLLALATTAAKVSVGAPLIAGLLLVALVGVVRRTSWRRWALIGASTSLAAGLLALILAVAGSAGGGGLVLGSLIDRPSSIQGLNPTVGSLGVLLGTGVLLLAVGARWAGVLWLVFDRRSRWEPVTVLGAGLAAVSLAALVAFNGLNAMWFSVGASGPLAPITAAGVGAAAGWLTLGRRRLDLATMALGGALVVYVAVWGLWATGASGGNVWVSTWRWAGPVMGVLIAVAAGWIVAVRSGRRPRTAAVVAGTIMVLVLVSVPGRLQGAGTGQIGLLQNGFRSEWFPVQEPWRYADTQPVVAWTDGMAQAGQWLRANAGQTDLVATNVTFDPLVPAFTRLQSWVSATRYQDPYGRPGFDRTLLQRETDSWAFIDTPSAATIAPLCQAGVRWVWVDPQRTETRQWAPWAVVAFESPDAIVLRLESAACSAEE